MREDRRLIEYIMAYSRKEGDVLGGFGGSLIDRSSYNSI